MTRKIFAAIVVTSAVFAEIRRSVSRTFSAIKLGGAVNYAFEYFGSKRPGTSLEGNAGYTDTGAHDFSRLHGRHLVASAKLGF